MTSNQFNSMSEATRLTREGRLAEATALIQRTLNDGSASVPLPTISMPTMPTIPMPTMPSGTGPASHARPHGMSHHVYRGAAGERSYLLHVPTTLPAGPVPLVLMLHGGTQDAAGFAAATGMNDLADQHGFVVAYPEQSTAANAMRYWNWFSPADQRRGSGEAAILAGMVAEVAGQHPIDPEQVFVAGFSAGAAMAAVLADQYPDVFAGVGIHSGLASGSATDMMSAFAAMRRAPASRPARRPVRAIIFHGAADPTVDVSNAQALAEQFAASGGEVTRTEGRDRKAFTRITIGALQQADCEVWIVQGAGHVWCGGHAGESYADPQAPNASAEMVRFFLADHEVPAAQAA